MRCQVCRTADNKDGRGPVKCYSHEEGLCWDCYQWKTAISRPPGYDDRKPKLFANIIYGKYLNDEDLCQIVKI
jgi:hypothetical protein